MLKWEVLNQWNKEYTCIHFSFIVKAKLQDAFLNGKEEEIHKTFDAITSLSKTVYPNGNLCELYYKNCFFLLQ